MASLFKESLVHLSDVAKKVPAGRGKRLHTSTVFRWIRDGVRGPDGDKVRLEHVRIGKYLYTSAEALERFVAATSPPVADSAPPPRSPSQRMHHALKARKELQELGVH